MRHGIFRQLGAAIAAAALALSACSPSNDEPAPAASEIGSTLRTAGWTIDSNCGGTGASILRTLAAGMAKAKVGDGYKQSDVDAAAEEIKTRGFLKDAYKANLRCWVHKDFPNDAIYTVVGDPDIDTELALIKVALEPVDNNLAAYAQPVATVAQLPELITSTRQKTKPVLGGGVEIGISNGHDPVANGRVGPIGLG